MNIIRGNGLKIKRVFLFMALSLVSACSYHRSSPIVEAIPEESSSSSADDSTNPSLYFLSKIIGNAPLVPVSTDASNLDAALRNTVDAFGLVTVGTIDSCTGTHLGNGYVLTAGHCFFSTQPGPQTISIDAPCPDTKVDWAYRGSPKTGNPKPLITLSSRCTNLVYAEYSKLRDFAIFKVDNAPQEFIALSNDNQRTTNGTKLSILGYPQGRPLEWSQYCPLVNPNDVPIMKTYLDGADQFIYQCDTEPGNSGSSILAINSAGVVKIVGVHNSAGPAAAPYNIGTYLYDARLVLNAKGINLDQLVASASGKVAISHP